jgi:hypothetical protein
MSELTSDTPIAQRSCTYACWTATRCASCKRDMAPRGRSIPLEALTSFCVCDGATDPKVNPRHLWNMHDSDRAYTDPIGWRAHVLGCSRCRGEFAPEKAGREE